MCGTSRIMEAIWSDEKSSILMLAGAARTLPRRGKQRRPRPPGPQAPRPPGPQAPIPQFSKSPSQQAPDPQIHRKFPSSKFRFPKARRPRPKRRLPVPQNAAGGRPLRVGLPPSVHTTAPSEPKRSTPAPCSWGGCASTRSRRHWLPALPARRHWPAILSP